MHIPAGRRASRRALIGGILVAPALVACGGRFPADTAGTLDRVTHGTTRIGVSLYPPFTEQPGRTLAGSEVDLVRRFCASLPSTPRWTAGAESDVIERLHLGALDLVIGGLDSDSPWSSDVALTRPYRTVTGPDGKPRRLVMAVRAGENAMLVALERFLAHTEGDL